LTTSKATELKRTISAQWKTRIAGIRCGRHYMTLLLLHSPWHPIQKTAFGACVGEAMDLIIRWLALMFSLGAWAGIALVMVTYLG